MQIKEKSRNKTKKPYETPRLRTIELESEQVLATGCKFADAGADVGSVIDCGPGNNCNEAGT